MSDDLVPYQPRDQLDSWVDMLGPVGDLAQRLARTQFVPRALQGNAAGVAAAVLTGRELGMGPMTSLRGLDIIEGRPSMTAQMLAARILAAGHSIVWKQSTDERCTVLVERGDGLSAAEVTWTLRDAQRAGLAGKQVWQRYPRHMLQHRALSEAAGMACPDVALGLEVADQVAQEGPRGPAGGRTVVQVQPAVSEPSEQAVAAVEAAPAPVLEPQPEAEPVVMVSRAQLTKLNAMLGDWEQLAGRRLDRAERRRFIGMLAEHPDPDTLDTAKDLTAAQADAAIGALRGQLHQMEADSTVEQDTDDEVTE